MNSVTVVYHLMRAVVCMHGGVQIRVRVACLASREYFSPSQSNLLSLLCVAVELSYWPQ